MLFLGLGSNKGDRFANLQNAVSALSVFVENMKSSSVYVSKALLPEGAPPEWDIDYLNMAVSCETKLTPHELLTRIKELEKKLGRQARGYWGPREIDIDILAFNDMVLNEEHLTIPHKYLLMRDFALIPLADIAPDWIYPVKGEFYSMTARTLAANLTSSLRKTDYIV